MSEKTDKENREKIITSIEQIEKLTKRRDVSHSYNIFIPSLNKSIPFTEINTSQQKRLVKSVLDSPVYNTEFIYTLREIISENCQDSTVVIDDLNILDKLIISLSLRKVSIGDKIENIEIETKGKKNVKVSFEITKILDNVLNDLNIPSKKEVEDDYFKVECSIPTIGIEYKLEKELRGVKTVNIEIEDAEKLRQTIGDAFVSEIVKYITKVYIKDEDDEFVPVAWDDFNFKTRIEIAEKFKTGLLKSILKYIEEVRNEIDKVEIVNFDFMGESYERRLTIDGSFFTIS